MHKTISKTLIATPAKKRKKPVDSGRTKRTKQYREKSEQANRSRWELYIDNSVRDLVIQFSKNEKINAGEAAEALMLLGLQTVVSGNANVGSLSYEEDGVFHDTDRLRYALKPNLKSTGMDREKHTVKLPTEFIVSAETQNALIPMENKDEVQ